ncbi:hypothetical protein LSAT2_007059 [Lamellibrachia satsuma]|nr:hypothetical protein LSAT2_007059 [Lamellibrachia satsuma]
MSNSTHGVRCGFCSRAVVNHCCHCCHATVVRVGRTLLSIGLCWLWSANNRKTALATTKADKAAEIDGINPEFLKKNILESKEEHGLPGFSRKSVEDKRKANVIALLKPDKSAEDPRIYAPILLRCTTYKRRGCHYPSYPKSSLSYQNMETSTRMEASPTECYHLPCILKLASSEERRHQLPFISV